MRENLRREKRVSSYFHWAQKAQILGLNRAQIWLKNERTIGGDSHFVSHGRTEHPTNQPFLYFGHFCDLRYQVL